MHVQRGNRNGALRVLTRARKTLSAAPVLAEVSTAGLEDALAGLCEQLAAGVLPAEAELPRGLESRQRT